ncbi:hypothetical protein FNF27_07028 [Cafeteria roenbergensis]|uniref:Ubiquitin-like domain-containing protein n=1 Tax=Cafeteria roenbergensis TaxID=33653 RepID=A0A5A8DVF4_CAFRO|nr:hypothetical protein FNF27_07028 [Cafeteria roenbergensis]
MLIRVIRVSTGAESQLTVDGARDTVGDIKRRLFAAELAAGKSVRLVCNGTLLQDDRSVRDLDGDPAVGLHGAPLHELVRDGARSCSAEHVTGLLLLLLWLLRWWAPHLVDSLATGILLLLSALWLAVASHCGSRWPRSLFDPRRLAAAD